MAVLNWPALNLKGASQKMPRVCPNCLAPATVDLRYDYISLLGSLFPLRATRYFQTFHYCAACADQAEAQIKHRNRTGWLFAFEGFFVLAMVTMLPWGLLFFGSARPDKSEADQKASAEVATIAFFAIYVLVVALAWGLVFFFKSRLKRRYPLRPQQAVWGPAAYYTGENLFASLPNAGYRAARSEWLKALVEANPDQVDDADYQRVAGAPKPQVDKPSPFAG